MNSPQLPLPRRTRQSGLSLIELIVFIVIVGVGLAGITVTYNTVVRSSADPMARKQALAIAESLLLEIEQQAFTYCDPQDGNVFTAAGTAGCALVANDQNKGGAAFPLPPLPVPSPPGEARGVNDFPYDNVADYAGFSAAASDIVGAGDAALAGYRTTVTITRAGGVAPFVGFPADAVLRIAVTVVGGGETITLVGFRARYAPNAAG